ncbi:hypothetical protein J437_LFUL002126 [Ladona fulva]|uniref:Glucosamine 6-phosphate N-acetyltransferase n=1 Tax=Ladona fulva TaxID=123851 RepID=A0A8K0JTS0_LADFU|nr:hypothetical protein J437_LFUL002126 [Ladona fulva]
MRIVYFSTSEMGPVHQSGHYPDAMTEDDYLYDPAIVQRLDFSKCLVKFNPQISAAYPGPGMRVRPLKASDYDRGFVRLLGQLTDIGEISRDAFFRRFAEMKKCPNTYFVTVIEDTVTSNYASSIIGAATLVIEQKFIHGCAMRGRLEDVVVNDTYRGRQLGKLIVATIIMLAREFSCYKISLDCKDRLIPFYQSLGFALEPGNANSMTMRLPRSSL